MIYNIHGFDKPFLEKAAQNKHDIVFTEKQLNIDTAILAKGFEAIAIFTSDNASAEVLEKLFDMGVRFIALRSAGYDHIDLAKAKQPAASSLRAVALAGVRCPAMSFLFLFFSVKI